MSKVTPYIDMFMLFLNFLLICFDCDVFQVSPWSTEKGQEDLLTLGK